MTKIGIRTKPDFDPCELFLGDERFVTLDLTKVLGSHDYIDLGTHGFYGFGGLAASSGPSGRIVDAQRFAPAVADPLDTAEDVSPAFERPSLFAGPQMQVRYCCDTFQSCFSTPLDDSEHAMDTKEKPP